MRLSASLFAKILAWFFLNMVLVAAALMVFFVFQQRINLQALFGRQGANRMQTTGRLISYDLSRSPQTEWPEILVPACRRSSGGFRDSTRQRSAFFLQRRMTFPPK